MEGFLQADKKKVIAVRCVLDNEEVGSTTRQGAASTFLKDVLFRINLALGGDQGKLSDGPCRELYDLCGQCPMRFIQTIQIKRILSTARI